VKRGISLRWRLILYAWFLALATALGLSVPVYLAAERKLLDEFGTTLQRKCDEVVTVLEAEERWLALDEFLRSETEYRSAIHTYYYQIRDETGATLARSRNLGAAELPLPATSAASAADGSTDIRTEAHPLSPEAGKVLVRSERIRVALPRREPAPLLIQVAISLGPFHAAMHEDLLETLAVAGASLAVVFILLWFVTGRALQPVSAMSSKASEITAMSQRERLPVTGKGDELDRLASVLNDMLDRLGASLRQMEQFASGAAHQLRTPITRIRGELELLLREELPDPTRRQLERVQEELERLTRTCGRLLLLARLDQQAAQASLLEERTQLAEVAANLLDYMGPVAQERKITLRKGRTTAVSVRGSRHLLSEAILNLLDNAVRYTPEGGTVTVSTELVGDAVRLSVEDSGPGVPPEERERIFAPFYRIPRAAGGESDTGSGLGLAIVTAIARAHRGSVELAQAPAGGSVFCMVLPAFPVA
jgi:two-component system, OmpR family, sensor kinase